MKDDFEIRRKQFRPKSKVPVLFVAESRPVGGTFFFNADSKLYRYVLQAFENALGKRWDDGDYFLNSFRDHGCYLDDLCAEPVNQFKNGEAAKRRAHHKAGVQPLSERLRRYDPQVLIIVKKDIAKHVLQASQLAGLDEIPHFVLPFPTMGWQNRFVKELTEILSSKLLRALMKIN